MKQEAIVIGGGLAGTEAALQLAKRGIKVKLYEMKPIKYSEAHSNKNLAEIVCSNSFKSNLLTNACGLLKEELRRLGSFLIQTADNTSVPAGQALAVDREEFAKKVTELIEKEENIELIREEIKEIPMDDFEKDLKWKEIVLKLMVLYPFNDIEQNLEQNLIYILLCNDEFKVLNEQELAFSKKLEDYIEQWNNL